jgi:indolepyruvate ferredoxin oxidoreductase alpha subunit
LKLPPFELFDYRVAMGSAIGVAAGLDKGGVGRRTVAIVGDSAFVHSGLSPLAGAAIKGWKALIMIMDNKVLGVTGCQPGPTAGTPAVDLVALCKACGVKYVEKVSTSEPSRLRQIFDDGLAANDLRVLVLEYPCNRCVDVLQR